MRFTPPAKTVCVGLGIAALYALAVWFISPQLLVFHRDEILFEEDVRALAYTLPILAALIGCLIAIRERNALKEVSQSVDKKYFVALGIVIAVFVLVCSVDGLSFKFFNPSDAEWADMHLAKDLAQGDKRAFFHLRDRIAGILTYAFWFKLAGFTPLVGTLFSLFAGAASIAAVFFLAQALFQDPRASVAASMLYALNAHTLVFTSIRMGNTIMVALYLLLFLGFALMAFKRHSFPLHLGALAWFTLMNQTKPEYFVLLGPYLLCFMLFKEYRHLSWKQGAGLIVAACVLSIPFFMTNAYFKGSTQDGWCGFPSQPFHDNGFYALLSPVLRPLDKAVQFVFNGRFALSYVFGDLGSFAAYWLSPEMVVLSAAALVGFLTSFRTRAREGVFLGLAFCIITFVYLADCIFYQERLAMPTWGIAALYAGWCAALASKFFAKKFSWRIPLFAAVIGLSLVLSLGSLTVAMARHRSYLNARQLPHSLLDLSQTYSVNVYGDLKSMLERERLSPDAAYLFVPNHAEMHALHFMGYGAMALSELFDESFFRDREVFWERFRLPLDPEKQNYFIESFQCVPKDQELGILCEYVKDRYGETAVGQWGVYSMYQLKQTP